MFRFSVCFALWVCLCSTQVACSEDDVESGLDATGAEIMAPGADGVVRPEPVESDADVDEVVDPVEEVVSPAEDVQVVPEPDEPFSFFVTSLEAMRDLSGSMDGFGGNLGGLEGADAICQAIAATVDGGHKEWRAFLSVTSGPDGEPVHAIERIGDGPWYDRYGRLVAMSPADLISERPTGADPQIAEDLPNEFGQTQKQFGDNHDTLTGSNTEGRLQSTDPITTCMDWTCPGSPLCPEPEAFEKKVMGGHSWPRDANAGGGGQGGGGGPPFLLSACEGKAEGDVCIASNNQGQFESVCEAIDDAGTLSCKAVVPPPWFFACSGRSEGDACDVTKGPNQFSGTCGVLEESPSLACLPEGFDPSTDVAANAQNPSHWIAAHTVPGCEPGVQLEQVGGGQGTLTAGGAGGYGGIYCFALTP